MKMERVKRSVHEKRAKTFRAFLHAEAQKPREEQNFPEESEWPSVQAHATCSTPNCAGYGVSHLVTLFENADGVYRVICGNCNQSMTAVLDLDED